jgi:late competence protein required for DNA uptake (superfamily II DNA/RNA helicase)
MKRKQWAVEERTVLMAITKSRNGWVWCRDVKGHSHCRRCNRRIKSGWVNLSTSVMMCRRCGPKIPKTEDVDA